MLGFNETGDGRQRWGWEVRGNALVGEAWAELRAAVRRIWSQKQTRRQRLLQATDLELKSPLLTQPGGRAAATLLEPHPHPDLCKQPS